MNKVKYVTSYFKPVGKQVSKKIPTGEKKKVLLGGTSAGIANGCRLRIGSTVADHGRR
ncbi:MAG: hypothetical protein ACQEW0_02120 [Pseudomonadota bacterium]